LINFTTLQTFNLRPQAGYTALGWKAKTGLREGIALAYQDFLAGNGNKQQAAE